MYIVFSDEDKPIGIIAGYLNEALFTNEKVALRSGGYIPSTEKVLEPVELLEAFQSTGPAWWVALIFRCSPWPLQTILGAVDKIYRNMDLFQKEVNIH